MCFKEVCVVNDDCALITLLYVDQNTVNFNDCGVVREEDSVTCSVEGCSCNQSHFFCVNAESTEQKFIAGGGDVVAKHCCAL